MEHFNKMQYFLVRGTSKKPTAEEEGKSRNLYYRMIWENEMMECGDEDAIFGDKLESLSLLEVFWLLIDGLPHYARVVAGVPNDEDKGYEMEDPQEQLEMFRRERREFELSSDEDNDDDR
ncbi:hypothetical protein HK098_006019, partial [Nowakowskiella sp. JEL0407]